MIFTSKHNQNIQRRIHTEEMTFTCQESSPITSPINPKALPEFSSHQQNVVISLNEVSFSSSQKSNGDIEHLSTSEKLIINFQVVSLSTSLGLSITVIPIILLLTC
ncbi:hypothetical protein NPIL_692951 [Nephila pilipes]|uniref:Uncharacterized protein n=1 Tax=Nephila pilipes TaxID=299642 RepID=A0A8X6QHE2_NEPPI|nr:hypothetical protein NPIL_692951 [Nephila pilipes]